MNAIKHIYLILAAVCFSCTSNNSNNVKDTFVDTMSPSEEVEVDSISETFVLPDSLHPFQCVIDTLNASAEPLVHAEYFLYDITGDGDAELWVKCGTCEADIDLWVYTAENGNVRKILSDYGGHTDFFINEGALGSITCNTGDGYVSSYEYKNGMIKVRSAEFSVWNEECEIRAIKKKEQPFIDKVLGEESVTITFEPLK